MHMHEKRCIKRAGVAGIALRASIKTCMHLIWGKACKSWNNWVSVTVPIVRFCVMFHDK